MKPAAFDYCRPDTVDEALSVLAQHGDDAAVLAGGLSLGPMLNMRVVRPAVVVDVNRIEALSGVDAAGNGLVRTGPLVRQADALGSRRLATAVPLLVQALPWVGHYQTRSRGTLGGSVAHADPSAEVPLALATLGGEVELAAARGTRRVPAAAFADGPLSTVRAPDELVAGLLWPTAADGEGTAFEEVAERHGDFAIVAAAATVRRESEDELSYRLGVAGASDRASFDEGRVEGRIEASGTEILVEIVEALVGRLEPVDDPRASGAFRRHLAGHLARRVLARALAGAGETTDTGGQT